MYVTCNNIAPAIWNLYNCVSESEEQEMLWGVVDDSDNSAIRVEVSLLNPVFPETSSLPVRIVRNLMLGPLTVRTSSTLFVPKKRARWIESTLQSRREPITSHVNINTSPLQGCFLPVVASDDWKCCTSLEAI